MVRSRTSIGTTMWGSEKSKFTCSCNASGKYTTFTSIRKLILTAGNDNNGKFFDKKWQYSNNPWSEVYKYECAINK